MKDLPVVICTSVIRSSRQGESHGGMYLVDFNSGKFKQVIDWNDPSINWEGRGADRGLRGIAFHDGMIISAASDEIFFYDQKFRIINSYQNRYLKHCHEIFVADNMLYLSSTGYDSILSFNLETRQFEKGYCYRQRELITTGFPTIDRGTRKLYPDHVQSYAYDPYDIDGPEPEDTHHINNVFYKDGHIYLSGRHMRKLIRIDKYDAFIKSARIPRGTHNVQFRGGDVIMNSTDHDSILIAGISGLKKESFWIPRYEAESLEHNNLGADHARQAFGRGLCLNGEFIIGGSSPGTISVYKSGDPKPIKSINLTLDIRNAIHGLEVYPYDASTHLS